MFNRYLDGVNVCEGKTTDVREWRESIAKTRQLKNYMGLEKGAETILKL